jgi:hypothetical protein
MHKLFIKSLVSIPLRAYVFLGDDSVEVGWFADISERVPVPVFRGK